MMGCLGIERILVLVLVFMVVELFDGGYFESGVTFKGCCFEEEIEFGRMLKHIDDFG